MPQAASRPKRCRWLTAFLAERERSAEVRISDTRTAAVLFHDMLIYEIHQQVLLGLIKKPGRGALEAELKARSASWRGRHSAVSRYSTQGHQPFSENVVASPDSALQLKHELARADGNPSSYG